MTEYHQVWVGNIPFGASETELRELLAHCGPIASFRFSFEKETKQFRGFAFCSYRDSESVETALRNLNGYEFMGRPLRLSAVEGRAWNDTSREPAPNERSNQSRVGVDKLAEDVADIYNRTASMDAPQLLHVLSCLQRLSADNPIVATSLLEENPQLSVMCLHAAYLLGVLPYPLVPLPDANVGENTPDCILQALSKAEQQKAEVSAAFALKNLQPPRCGPTTIDAVLKRPLEDKNVSQPPPQQQAPSTQPNQPPHHAAPHPYAQRPAPTGPPHPQFRNEPAPLAQHQPHGPPPHGGGGPSPPNRSVLMGGPPVGGGPVQQQHPPHSFHPQREIPPGPPHRYQGHQQGLQQQQPQQQYQQQYQQQPQQQPMHGMGGGLPRQQHHQNMPPQYGNNPQQSHPPHMGGGGHHFQQQQQQQYQQQRQYQQQGGYRR